MTQEFAEEKTVVEDADGIRCEAWTLLEIFRVTRKIWHVILKRHRLPCMGRIVQSRRESRTQGVESAAAVKVGSFEPGRTGK